MYKWLVCVLFTLSLAVPFIASADNVDVTITVRFFECNDSTDNDGDGDIDYPDDDGCTSETDDDESDEVLPQCSDTTDNDSDGLTDFPADPGCESTSDDDETDPESTSGSSGGGGIANSIYTSEILFNGQTSPHALVFLLKDGAIFTTTTADAAGLFSITREGLVRGTYIFSLYVIDTSGLRSGLLSFQLDVARNTFTEASNIFIPPTIHALSDVSGAVIIEGRAAPQNEVELVVNDSIVVHHLPVDTDGYYRVQLTEDELPDISEGYTIRAVAILDEEKSPFSTSVALTFNALGTSGTYSPGDFSNDGKVDLVDFSIAAYWFGQNNVPARFDLDNSGAFDLKDFSIMVYYWSG